MGVVRKFDSYDSFISYYISHRHNVNELNLVDTPFVVFADAEMKSSDCLDAVVSFFMSLRNNERLHRYFGKVLRSIKNGTYSSKGHGCYWVVKPLSSGYWYIAVSDYKKSS